MASKFLIVLFWFFLYYDGSFPGVKSSLTFETEEQCEEERMKIFEKIKKKYEIWISPSCEIKENR